MGLLFALLVMVASSVKSPAPARPSPAPSSAASLAPGTPRMGGVVYRKLDAQGNERFLLEADGLEGQEQEEVRLSGVRMTFPYTYQGELAKATIVSRRARYSQNGERAVFEGAVKVTTEDGFELQTESLAYRGDRGLARTESPLTFRRNTVSGSATGAVYRSEEGLIELLADVMVRVEGEDGPPLEIRSREARINRVEGVVYFVGEVHASQSEDTLDAGTLQIAFAEEERQLVAFSAVDHAVLNVSPGSGVPGLGQTANSKGRRILKGQRIDVGLGPGRKVRNATAGPDAELEVLPGPDEPQQHRQLFARFLTFRFDAEGRLSELHGQKDVEVRVQPAAGDRGQPRTLTCRALLARFEVATGEVKNIDFSKDVVVTEGSKRGTSDRGFYDGRNGLFLLDRDPEIKDAADDSEIAAREIRISTRSGDVSAGPEVRHVLGRSSPGARRDLLSATGERTLVTCGSLAHDRYQDVTRYERGVVMRSDRDELRAETIVIAGKPGQRTLQATQNVVSLYHPQPAAGKPEPELVDVRAREMLYQEAEGHAVYDGDVIIRQGDLLSKSPKATADLTADGSAVQKLVAGDPVEVQQGPRRATGQQATYTPSDEILVVVGEKVVLKEPNQEAVGRSMTFRVREEQVVVDGAGVSRTETILKQEPLP